MLCIVELYDPGDKEVSAVFSRFDEKIPASGYSSKTLKPTQPIENLVPTGAVLVHQLQVVDFKRLKSPTRSIDRTGCSLRVQDRSRRRPVNPSTTK
jgi:hypothetical protein